MSQGRILAEEPRMAATVGELLDTLPAASILALATAADRAQWHLVEEAAGRLKHLAADRVKALLDEGPALFTETSTAAAARFVELLEARWPGIFGTLDRTRHACWAQAARRAHAEKSAGPIKALLKFGLPCYADTYLRNPSTVLQEFGRRHSSSGLVSAVFESPEIFRAALADLGLASAIARYTGVFWRMHAGALKALAETHPNALAIYSAFGAPETEARNWLREAAISGKALPAILFGAGAQALSAETLAEAARGAVAAQRSSYAVLLLKCALRREKLPLSASAVEAFVALASLQESLKRGESFGANRARFRAQMERASAEASAADVWKCACLYDSKMLVVEVFAELLRGDPELVGRELPRLCARLESGHRRLLRRPFGRVFGEIFREKPETMPALFEQLEAARSSLDEAGLALLSTTQRLAVEEGLAAGRPRMVLEWRAVDRQYLDHETFSLGMRHSGQEFVSVLCSALGETVLDKFVQCLASASADVLEMVCTQYSRARDELFRLACEQPECIPALQDSRLLLTMLASDEARKPSPEAAAKILRAALRRRGAPAVVLLADSGLLARALAAEPGLALDIYALESAEAWTAAHAAMNAADPGGLARAVGPFLEAFKAMLRAREPRDRETEAALVAAGLLDTM